MVKLLKIVLKLHTCRQKILRRSISLAPQSSRSRGFDWKRAETSLCLRSPAASLVSEQTGVKTPQIQIIQYDIQQVDSECLHFADATLNKSLLK